MGNTSKWYKCAWWVSVAMALLGVGGLTLDLSTHLLGNGGTVYYGNYEGLEPRLWASIGLSVLLIVLNLILCIFVLLTSTGQRGLVRYASTCIVLLGVQAGLNMIVMGGPMPELADLHTRRMYLGYLAAMGTPLVVRKGKEAMVTGGRGYGQSLLNRIK